MLIPDSILDRINEEPVEAVQDACNIYLNFCKKNVFSEMEHDSLEIVKFLCYVNNSGAFKFNSRAPEIVNGKVHKDIAKDFVTKVMSEVDKLLAHQKILKHEADLDMRFTQKIKNSFGYEFTEGDLKEVQSLINKLRDLIAECKDLDSDHRARLQKRLEQVQRELHKKVSSLDHIYALAIEASIVAGKVGNNAKPLIEAAKDLMGISWRTHAHSEGLPSNSEAPMLGRDVPLEEIE